MTLNPADDRFIAHLCQALPERLFSAASQRYLEEPRGRWAGQNAWLARPETTKEVSLLVKAASVAHVPILPYGCLLYTSPSPRDRQKSRMPSSA